MAKRKTVLTQQQLQEGKFEGKTHLVVELLQDHVVQFSDDEVSITPAGSRAVVLTFGRVESNKHQLYVAFPMDTAGRACIDDHDKHYHRAIDKVNTKALGRIDYK